MIDVKKKKNSTSSRQTSQAHRPTIL